MRLAITINGHRYEAEVEVLDDDAPAPAAGGGATPAVRDGPPRRGPEAEVEVLPVPEVASGARSPHPVPPGGPPLDVAGGGRAGSFPPSGGPVAVGGMAAPLALAVDASPVRAALPGVVTEVRVAPGQGVAVGDVLLVLEAMKMDNDVTAPVAGTVRDVLVAPGDQVAAQQPLLMLVVAGTDG